MAVTDRLSAARLSAARRLGPAALCLGLVGCASSTPRGPGLVGQTVSIELPDLKGQPVSLGAREGQVVLVDVWATWCGPCVAAFAAYADLYRRYQGSGFEVLAISVDQEDAEVRRFVARHDVPFTILRDPQGSLPERIDLRTMPTALLVGRDGKVKQVHEGFVPGDGKKLERALVALLEEARESGPTVATSTGSGP